MSRLTCGQCGHGPAAGMKKKKCVWSGDIRGQGAMACKTHFASSVKSGLRCSMCKGSLNHYEAKYNENLCSKCNEQRLRVIRILIELLLVGIAGLSLAAALVHLGWL